jgi:hypothetical protein
MSDEPIGMPEQTDNGPKPEDGEQDVTQDPSVDLTTWPDDDEVES